MTDSQQHSARVQHAAPPALLMPPMAPRIAALATRDPDWGMESRWDKWKRRLFGNGAGAEQQTAERSPENLNVTLPVATALEKAEAGGDAVTAALRQEIPVAEVNVEVPEESGASSERVIRDAEEVLPLSVESETSPSIEDSDQALVEPDLTSAEAEAEVNAAESSGQIVGAAEPVAATPVEPEKPKESGFSRIRRALSRTGEGFERVFLGQKQIDDDLLEDLETQLLTADLGMEVTTEVIDALTERLKRNELKEVGRLQAVLKELLVDILAPCEKPLEIGENKPFVILTVGVNGVGKTTTIGKLAKQNLNHNRSVILAAGDTFRAAAVEQLQTWGERNNVPVVAQHTGADSASVIYDALESARARKQDVLIADTAGRLHNKDNLMDELRKIKRVMGKLDDTAPHEVLLVLDAGTGQNAVNQLQQFNNAVGVTGLVLTKLDGTAKGGVIFALCRKFGIPVRYIGVGEGVDDLQPFSASDFVDALLASGEHTSSTVH